MFDGMGDLPTLSGAILVIDDDDNLRQAMIAVLSALTTVPVYSAANGQEGLEFILQEEAGISLIFLDMNMPVMNGEETYGRLQIIAPDVKVIICSSLSPSETQLRLGQNRIPTFLQKPYDMSALVNTIVMLFSKALELSEAI
jgi:DNA-binding NtrC family response regulator